MIFGINGKKKRLIDFSLTYGIKYRAVGQVWHVGTHFSFLFSIYSENHGVQAEPLNFTRSSDITYVWGTSVGDIPKTMAASTVSDHRHCFICAHLWLGPFVASPQMKLIKQPFGNCVCRFFSLCVYLA